MARVHGWPLGFSRAFYYPRSTPSPDSLPVVETLPPDFLTACACTRTYVCARAWVCRVLLKTVILCDLTSVEPTLLNSSSHVCLSLNLSNGKDLNSFPWPHVNPRMWSDCTWMMYVRECLVSRSPISTHTSQLTQAWPLLTKYGFYILSYKLIFTRNCFEILMSSSGIRPCYWRKSPGQRRWNWASDSTNLQS